MWKSIITIVLAATFMSCKHNHTPPSETLQQAYAIQQEALKIHKELREGGQQLPPALVQRQEQWLKNMIEIPGMDHDHSNCNHDHSRQTISISDEEMLAVQQAWMDSIVVIAKELKASAQ